MKPITLLALVLMSGCISQDPTQASRESRIYSTDEREIRMAICLARLAQVNHEIWFVDESLTFIEDLKRTSGIPEVRHIDAARYDKRKQRPVDRRTGETGFMFKISEVAISGDEATASVSWYASPIGGEWYSVRLRKREGRWVADEWKLEMAA